LIPFQLIAQVDSGWRISPTRINIQLGEERRLQLLDDSAQELHGATWSVDNPDTGEIQEEDGYVVLHPKEVGTVLVTAAWGGETRTREIRIWSPVRAMPEGTTQWGLDPIGREIKDLPAVPTPDGPTIYSLEQTSNGKTYLRADANDGIQVWTWLMPESTRDVELLCGDWMGGALISANRPNSYTLYAVGKDGNLRWKRTMSGVRKAFAFNLEHLVHVLSQSPDGTAGNITGLDEETGAKRFELPIPGSQEKQINIRANFPKEGSKIVCAPSPLSTALRSIASRLIVNMDGLAYVAFTEHEWKLSTAKCAPGSIIDARNVDYTRDEKVVLWQIHPDGTYRSTIIEANKSKQSLSTPVSVPSPTGGLIPDGLNGVLVSIRFSHDSIVENVHDEADEFVYRINPNGEVAYKLLMPRYSGKLQDDMVLGEHDLGFATRGGVLVAFNVRNGREVWQWDSNTPEISVYAALANGGCAVKTPTGLVQVENGVQTKDLMDGNVFMGWQGQMFRSHN
jgi:outer membrane protein assembly factor BamB